MSRASPQPVLRLVPGCGTRMLSDQRATLSAHCCAGLQRPNGRITGYPEITAQLLIAANGEGIVYPRWKWSECA